MRVLLNAASVRDATGGATVTEALACGLCAGGVEVFVMLGRHVDRLRSVLVAQGISVLESPLPTSAGRLLWQWAWAGRIARGRRCDLLLTTNIGVMERVVPQVVLHQNSKHFQIASRWSVLRDQGVRGLVLRLLAQSGVRRASANVFISEYLKTSAEDCLGPVPRSVVIHNGVHLEAEGAARSRPRPESPVRVLLVTADSPHKHNDVAVKALGSLIATLGDDVTLRIAGDGHYPETRALVEELGVGSQVEWLGGLRPDAMTEEYKSADLLWHVSPLEAFGLPILEAIQCGTPVVCADSGAAREVAGVAAAYFRPGGHEELAALTVALLHDPCRLQAMREAGLDRLQQYSWRRSVAALRGLLEAIASASEGRHGADEFSTTTLDSS